MTDSPGSSLRSSAVLVTGANGFIGSHLTKRLFGLGADIHVLVRKDSDQQRIRSVAEGLTIWLGDIRDYHAVRQCLKASRPQVIFHLAAARKVDRDAALIDLMIDINLRGTMNLLQAVVEEGISLRCFINTGSSEEYGDGTAPFMEEQRERPVSPYSASKVASTYFCQMLYKSMGLPVVTLRPFLTYGPDQDDDMFIPSLIKHCLEKTDFRMTAGDQTREFNYIDDVVDAYLCAAERPEAAGKVINIGNGAEYSIRTVAEMVVKMMGDPIRILAGAIPKRPGEAAHFYCDNSRMKDILGLAPKVLLQEGLEKTIAWAREYHCAGNHNDA